MTTQNEALKLALEALGNHGDAYLGHSAEYYFAIKKVKKALAQPEQEPVAYIQHHKGGDNLEWDDPGGKRTPLYTTPPQQKPLTDEQRKGITAMWSRGHRNYTVADIIDAVEAAHGIKE